MIETCAGFHLLTQAAFGGGDALTFSVLRLRSGRHMKSLQFMTDLILLLFSRFTIDFATSHL